MSTGRRSRPTSAVRPTSASSSLTHRDALSSSSALLTSSTSFAHLENHPNHQHHRPHAGDSEELAKQVRDLKEVILEREQENAFLKAQMQRLIGQMKKKDKQIDQIAAMKISSVADPSGDAILAGQLRDLRSEMTAISRLNEKFRDVESELYKRTEELRKIRSSLKYTQGREVEIETQVYYNELRRTRKQLLVTQNQVKSLQSQMSAMAISGNHTSSLASSQSNATLAYDTQMFQALRSEVEGLRSENIQLRASSSMNGSRPSNLHVLHGKPVTQSSKDLRTQIDREADRLVDSKLQQRHQQQSNSHTHSYGDESYHHHPSTQMTVDDGEEVRYEAHDDDETDAYYPHHSQYSYHPSQSYDSPQHSHHDPSTYATATSHNSDYVEDGSSRPSQSHSQSQSHPSSSQSTSRPSTASRTRKQW